ncbi:hypothetical protein MMC20_000080 [Loxospora ochrophaea]|nr:hypothetical protein [Loxospora ochrophaea]
MSTTITIPSEYGYVLLSATASTFVGLWTGLRIGAFRKAAGVPYPNPYAAPADADASEEKYLFNCAQRAHANFVENHSTFLVVLLIAGIKYPVVSAGMGAVWGVGRVAYAVGYTMKGKKNGSGRRNGILTSGLVQTILSIMAGVAAYGMVMQ